jgi:hypothetical protein
LKTSKVRITRLICATGKRCELTANPKEPSLLLALSAAQLREKSKPVKLEPGQTATGWQRSKSLKTLVMLRWNYCALISRPLPLKNAAPEKHTHPHQ